MSEPRKWATGDVATLNSGGPPMTVYSLDSEKGMQKDWLECTWFDGVTPKYCCFPKAALMLIVGADE